MIILGRFKLEDNALVGYFESKDDALRAAIPGDSLFDCKADSGEVELWIVSGDMNRKILRPIRRRTEP